MNKCNKCGYEWKGMPSAVSCPRCKSYRWKYPIITDESKRWKK